MPLEDHKHISRRALEMWASNNPDRPEDIFSEDYVNHQESDVEGGVSTRSLESWKELVRGYHDAFSSSKIQVLMQIAESDLVATRWEFTSTHTGDYMGVAPTGKEITWTGVQIDRFANGKIVESWVDWDKYRFFQALGLVS
jgi:predicted ester cyclase